MRVHLIDGTYELFRQHFGRMMRDDPRPNAATIGVLLSTLALIDEGATHIGVASDHVIESFRNDLWPGYKTSLGMPPELLGQLALVEEALEAMGVTVWAMVEHEADDALGAAARVADADETVEQALILTPDKDLGQCVRGRRIVQFDRRKRELIDHDGVVAKFGVEPASIPDYLGLVGDSSDGFPGLPGWGARSAASVLARYRHLEYIPAAAGQWDVAGLRGAAKLAATLQDHLELAVLFRRLATLETDIDVGTVESWRWSGPSDDFPAMTERLHAPELLRRAVALGARVEVIAGGTTVAAVSTDELDEYEDIVDHDEALVSGLEVERDLSDADELADVESERDATPFDQTRCAYSGATGDDDDVDVRELRSAGALLDDPELDEPDPELADD